MTFWLTLYSGTILCATAKKQVYCLTYYPRFAKWDFGEQVIRQAYVITQIMMLTGIERCNHDLRTFMNALYSNWYGQSINNEDDDDELKSLIMRLGMLSAVSELPDNTLFLDIAQDTHLIILGAHPPHLCSMLHSLRGIRKKVGGTLLIGSSQPYERPVYSNCKHLRSNQRESLAKLGHYGTERDIMYAYFNSMNATAIAPEFSNDLSRINPLLYSNTDNLWTFLERHPTYLLNQEHIILVAAQPYLPEASLIVGAYAPNATIYRFSPKTDFTQQESLHALASWMLTSRRLNKKIKTQMDK